MTWLGVSSRRMALIDFRNIFYKCVYIVIYVCVMWNQASFPHGITLTWKIIWDFRRNCRTSICHVFTFDFSGFSLVQYKRIKWLLYDWLTLINRLSILIKDNSSLMALKNYWLDPINRNVYIILFISRNNNYYLV